MACSRMAALMSSASANAARPCSPVTAGWLAGADAFEEGFDFETQRLAGGDGGLGESEAAEDAGGVWRSSIRSGLWLYVDEEQVLAGVIDRDVLMRLEEAQFADALGADAAGGEVGDASGSELDANVGDIDLAREYGKPDGLERVDGRFDEA